MIHNQEFNMNEKLTSWVENNLILDDQKQNIMSFEQNLAKEQSSENPIESKRGLNLIYIAYYVGGFMVLLAYTTFMSISWDQMAVWLQTAVSLGTIIILWLTGHFLDKNQFHFAGRLLVFVGTGITPLLFYSIQNLIGIWPDFDFIYGDFYRVILPNWVIIEVLSLLTAWFVIRKTKFPLITLLISIWMLFLGMDFGRWLFDLDAWQWGNGELELSLTLALGMIGLAIFLQRRDLKSYSFWFHLVGSISLVCTVVALLDWETIWADIIYVSLIIVLLILSVWLQQRVLLVISSISLYSYLCYLAFDIFDGELSFLFAMAFLGLMIVITAVGYQKYVKQWLESKLLDPKNIAPM